MKRFVRFRKGRQARAVSYKGPPLRPLEPMVVLWVLLWLVPTANVPTAAWGRSDNATVPALCWLDPFEGILRLLLNNVDSTFGRC